jgi:CHAT domain-containing protein/tetratricopeptide (TPR) repeat protein
VQDIRSRITARKISEEAEKLQQTGTAESLRKAIGKYEEALPHWRAAGDLAGEAETTGSIGEIHLMLGEFQKALTRLELALPLFRAVPDTKKAAHTLANLGYAYDNLGEKQKAVAYYSQALEILRAINDDYGEAATLSNLGLLYQSIGELQKALAHYFQALPLARALKEQFGEATILNGIGAVYTRLRETDKALSYLTQALQRWQEVKNAWGEAATLNNFGYNYERQDETQKALDYFDRALRRWREIGNPGGEAGTLTNIGRLYDKMGQKQQALDSLGKALTLYQKIKSPDGIANVFTAIGNVHYSLKDLPPALEHYQRALPLVRTMGDRDGEANILHGIARVERDLGRLSAAREHIETALKLRESIRGEVAGQEVRAAYLASFQSYYELYLDILIRQHQQQPAEGHDATALHVSERARARSLVETLVEARADIRRGVESALLARENELQQRLNAKEQYRRQLLSRKPTEEQVAAADEEIEDLMIQYQEIQAQIRATSPSYAALTQPQPLSLREIQQQVLDDETILLEYALGEQRSFLWAVTPTTINSFVLPKRATLDSLARRVYDLLTARNQSLPNETEEQKEMRFAQTDREFSEAAAALSQALLRPVAELIGTKRLLIVSDGALQYLPFGILPVISNQLSVNSKPSLKTDHWSLNTDYWSLTTDYRPLILDHEIVHLPSASVLAILRRELAGRQPAAKTVAVLADPVFASHDARVKRGKDKFSKPAADSTLVAEAPILESALVRSVREMGITDSGEELPRLLFSRREAEGIMRHVPAGEGKKAVDFTANRATATNPELSRYRIVHFATHGLLNSKQPELSGIVLSLVDEQGKPQDGFLRLHEIYNLNLPADLVVLSACQTGLGKEIKGEGLVGLTRGFMYAGAARVVASLWSVKDDATAELMKRFYEKMLVREKLRPAAALRAAQVEMWDTKRWRAPYFWAGFVLQGEWR